MVIVLRVLLFHLSDLPVSKFVGLKLCFTLFWRQFRAERSLVAKLSTVVTHWRSLRKFFTEISSWRKLKPRMHVLTSLSIRTKASQIILAQNSSHVSVSAAGSMSAEAAIIPRAILDLALRIDVQKRALLLVTGIESGVEVALGHLSHIIFVQKLAAVAFLAKSSQPMLAHDRLLLGFYVPKRAKLLIAST